MAKGLRNASGLINQMSYNPLRQQELQQFEMQEGMDNKAISARDHFLGKQVANEQSKIMQSEQIGDDLAMRKDKLAHAKKISDQRIKMSKESLNLGKEKLAHQKSQDSFAFSLGMLSTAVEGLNMFKNKVQDWDYKRERDDYVNFLRESQGYTPPEDTGTHGFLREKYKGIKDFVTAPYVFTKRKIKGDD